MKLTFEQILVFIVVGILAATLGVSLFQGSVNLTDTIVQTFIMIISTAVGFFFTKHKPDKKDDEQ